MQKMQIKLVPKNLFSTEKQKQSKHKHTLTHPFTEISEWIRALKFAKADLSGLLGLKCLLFKMENIIVCYDHNPALTSFQCQYFTVFHVIVRK